MQAPPLPTYKVKVSDDSMMSSMSSISSTDVDNAMFMNEWKKDGSWDTMTGSRKAGRFDPITPGGTGEMKRLGISERYEKFHHISTAMKDSKKSAIPCKRLECEGVLTNIGPTPKRVHTKLKRARERMQQLTKERACHLLIHVVSRVAFVLISLHRNTAGNDGALSAQCIVITDSSLITEEIKVEVVRRSLWKNVSCNTNKLCGICTS